MTQKRHILLRLADRRRLVTDPRDIYYLEADGDDTLVRFRGKERVRDVRPLSELEKLLKSVPFVRIHRSYLVNPARLQEIRPRDAGRGWEVVLQPPVNRILPISEERFEQLLEAYR